MNIEFRHHGKTYQCSRAAPADEPPPNKLSIVFQPCVLRPPFLLELAFLGTDGIRGIELYRPVQEIHDAAVSIRTV